MVYKMIQKVLFFVPRIMCKYKKLLIASVLAGCALFLGLALWHYFPNDNSLFHYSTEQVPVANYCGHLGAIFAAFMIYFFGGASFVLIALLLLCSYIIIWHRSLKIEWDRMLMLFIMLFVFAALLASYSFDPFCSDYPGGYCGITLWQVTTNFFDQTAATFVLSALLFVTVVIISRFPFVIMYHYVFKIIQFFYSKRFIVVPLLKAGKGTIYYMVYYPCKVICCWVFGLFAGTSVVKAGRSILMFDHDHDDDGEVEDILQDDIWQAYCATLSNDSCDKKYDRKDLSIEKHDIRIISDEVATQKVGTAEKSTNIGDTVDSYALPDPGMFIDQRDEEKDGRAQSELESRARILEEKLERFGVSGKVVEIKRGPVVTLFEYQPQIDTKLSKIVALEDDLAMALQALSIRIIAPIPGRAVVGFEVSNNIRQSVLLGSIIQSKKFRSIDRGLPLILGCDTVGNDVIIDLAKMPHLLIAGSTGSGKSVALNSMLVSLLCRCSPEQLRLILIDPKRLEFAAYEDVAHLLFPIVTDPKQAILALRWVTKEMERRYEIMKELGARNMLDYNKAAARQGYDPLPFIVIIIDELSDLMVTAGRDIEDLIIRITQMARAAGIHMLVATQRPSVDVITGVIKVNFPSRISFRVTSKGDSRTILDCGGAEKLLGRGDMLFLDAVSSQLQRVHGAYVSDVEIDQLVESIKKQREPHYYELTEENVGSVDLQEGDNKLYNNIVTFLEGVDEVSISLLQRRFRIGYNRSARIIEMLELEGIIAPSDGGKMRKVIHK